MKRILSGLLTLVLLLGLSGCRKEQTKFSDYSFDYFDTVTTIVGYADSKEEFDTVAARIKDALKEYHQLFTIYQRFEGIQNLCTVNEVTNGVHREVEVDPKIMDLLVYARDFYYKTNGKMNIAMGSVLSIWHDYRETGMNDPAAAELPPMAELLEAAEHIDIEKMVLNTEKNTVFLSDPAMKLDVGAIAKGYAVEQVARELEQDGIHGYILNVGGNVRTLKAGENREPWAVGIENPDTEDETTPYIAYLHLNGESLVTSGSYQRYYTVDGKNYHHIIDPETLMPGENFKSVSILCGDSAAADGYSTALFSMSFEEGLALVESLEGMEALWVLADGTQRTSSGFDAYTFDYK